MTHTSILSWEIPRTGEPGESLWGGKEPDTTEHRTAEHKQTSILENAYFSNLGTFTKGVSNVAVDGIPNLHCICWRRTHTLGSISLGLQVLGEQRRLPVLFW